jgi:subtilisin family serine protease
MKRIIQLLVLCSMVVGSAQAGQRLIVSILGGELLLDVRCLVLGCTVNYGLGDPLGRDFLVSVPDTTNLSGVITSLSNVLGVVDIEIDVAVKLSKDQTAIPPALYESNLVPYAGVNVRAGYLDQPAAQILRYLDAQKSFNVTGAGTVAVIDTGVDPNHPILQPVLVSGYDFTRNGGNGSEMGDVGQSTAAVVDGSSPPAYVGQSTAAVVDGSTADSLNNPATADFGHGTMVAGIVHLVAPTARIMPLKAFASNGSGYISDVIRAVYYAVRAHAKVINMSFSTSQDSLQLAGAVSYATLSGTLCVAAAGNDGAKVLVYPAAYRDVVGVASTSNIDVRSTFSNYGSNLVWVAAPGEGVITTYPFGTWAAGWGTSFSTPFVSGTAALMLQGRPSITPNAEATALGSAKPLGPDLGNGRLDSWMALQWAMTARQWP